MTDLSRCREADRRLLSLAVIHGILRLIRCQARIEPHGILRERVGLIHCQFCHHNFLPCTLEVAQAVFGCRAPHAPASRLSNVHLSHPVQILVRITLSLYTCQEEMNTATTLGPSVFIPFVTSNYVSDFILCFHIVMTNAYFCADYF